VGKYAAQAVVDDDHNRGVRPRPTVWALLAAVEVIGWNIGGLSGYAIFVAGCLLILPLMLAYSDKLFRQTHVDDQP
jgi:hypothetical protein